MARNKNSAAFQEFLKYKVHILEKFLDKFGKSYDSVESLRDRWFHEYKYTADAEQFLIDESKLYLRLCPHYREIKFLNALTTHMAEYLSEYTMKYTEYPDKDARRAGRKIAKQKLKDELFTKNKYIQQLIYHKNTRGLFSTKAAEGETKRKRNRIKKHKHDYEIHKQVQAEFCDVNQFRKK